MKNILKSLFVLPLALALCSLAFGQATTTSTTFSLAVAYGDSVVNVTSATGMSAPVQGAFQTLLYVDKEAMGVMSINGTSISVQRGLDGTKQSAHATSAPVWIGAPNYFSLNSDPTGACTSTNEAALPRFFEMSGNGWTCPSTGYRSGLWTLAYPAPNTTAPPDNTQAGSSVSYVAHARYNFATDGGAISTITPAIGATIPINAVITKVLITCITTTVGSTGNVSAGLSAGGAGAAALWAATARASCSAGTMFDGVPLAGATASLANATYIKMSAAGNVTFTIASNALTAGVVDIDVWYTVLIA